MLQPKVKKKKEEEREEKRKNSFCEFITLPGMNTQAEERQLCALA